MDLPLVLVTRLFLGQAGVFRMISSGYKDARRTDLLLWSRHLWRFGQLWDLKRSGHIPRCNDFRIGFS
jgi:hypothetical protein